MRQQLVVLCSFFSLVAAAQDLEVREGLEEQTQSVEAQPCRPTIACMAELVPQGYFEIEAGYGGSAVGSGFRHTGLLLIKYSVLDRLQLQLATNNVFLAGAGMNPRAFDGVMPGLKWKVNDQGSLMPSNALSVHLMMPTHGFSEAAQKTYDLQAWWYLSKDVSRVHADLNVMLNVFDLGGTPVPQGLAALAVSVDLVAGFGAFTELYSGFGNAAVSPLDGGSLSGLSYSPIDEIAFDVGVDVGFYPGTRLFTVFAGVTFVPRGRVLSRVTNRPARNAPLMAARP